LRSERGIDGEEETGCEILSNVAIYKVATSGGRSIVDPSRRGELMRLLSHPRFLAVYSGVLTVVFAATVVLGIRNGVSILHPVHAEESARNATFDEITVQRINVVEPDGTPRLVIADKGKFPGSFFKGKEGSRADRTGEAGMLFMNAEGTENGGLIFGGYQGTDGVPHAWGHLSFDEYEQDQTMSLDTGQDGKDRHAGLQISDNGTALITPEVLAAFERAKTMPVDTAEHVAAKKKGMAELLVKYPIEEHPRAYLGRDPDKGSSLRLADVQGKNRIILRVGEDGTPEMEFLDAAGKVTARWPK
jgi:hypothetical protein